ncbi:MAG: hypothetical protein INH34_15710 [Phycisphaerales bacterium]|nr:hypothetical protein [Phycisphaerales bacterium]
MADNVGYTPGSGATVAADEIGGVLFQRVKPVHGADGTATDTSATNPLPIAAYGELIEAIQALSMAVHSLTRSIGQTTVDPTTGRLRAEVVQGTAASLQTTATIASGTVTTVSTVSNQTQMGGLFANDQIPSLMTLRADSLLRNISVT